MTRTCLFRKCTVFSSLAFGVVAAGWLGGGCGSSGQSVQGTGGAASQCPAGQTLCAGQCVDTRSDLGNCGECGASCPSGQTCSVGVCGCASGLTACGAECVDLKSNAKNCGACGAACATGETCADGVCTDSSSNGIGGADGTGGGASAGGETSSTGGETSSTGGRSTGGASTGGASTGGASTGGAGSGSCTPWPEASGTEALTATRRIMGEYDGQMVRYTGWGGSQDENQDPLFEMTDGSTMRNVIIGAPAGDGIHCEGTCTLENVWWEDVGEDAATLLGSSSSQVFTIRCAGARSASDKIFQHNGAGTFKIEDFWAEDFGKIYRSCGNCGTQYERHAILSNIIATGGDVIAGVNTNYGDTASFWNVSAGGATICERYTGNDTGAEPVKTGSGIDGQYCIELDSAP